MPRPPTIRSFNRRRRKPMSRLDDLAERIERLVLRHEELQRTNALLQTQLGAVTTERDSLRSRLAAARARIDALLDRLPVEPVAAAAPALARKTDAA
jgi:cell division protein ZapB